MKKKGKIFRKKSRKKKFSKLSPQSFIVRVIVVLLLTLFFTLLPGQNIYYRIVFDDVLAEDLPEISPAPLPVNITGLYPEQLTAEGIIVEDLNSAVQVFTRNPKQQMAPASTTKMMTALVAYDLYELNDIVSVDTVVTEGRVMGLQVGEEISVENLLYGILIHSGNDAAQALAEGVPGGSDAFLVAMNARAKRLALGRTHFTNPMGFDDENHYSTPSDLARLAKVVLSNKELTKMVGIPAITVSDTSYSLFHPLTNVNELVGRVPGVSGLKTGFTENAGESVITVAQRGNRRILIVVLNSQDRFTETEQLINWVFNNYRWVDVEPST